VKSGLSLQYIERVPSRRSGAMPLVVVLHGCGADANDLADVAPMIDGPGGYRFGFAAPMSFEPHRGSGTGVASNGKSKCNRTSP
jgi:predicted esterase